MSDLPTPSADLAGVYALLGEVSGTASALRDGLAAETKARETEILLLERKQLTAERATRWAKRASFLAVASVVLVVVVFTVLWNRRVADQTHTAIVNCQNANVSRQAIIDEFSSFITVLVAISPPATTSEVAAARQQVVDKLRADFAAATPPALLPRDCSVKAVTSPTTLAPRS